AVREADIPEVSARELALETHRKLKRRRLSARAASRPRGVAEEIEHAVDAHVAVGVGAAREQELDLRRQRKCLRFGAAADRGTVEPQRSAGLIGGQRRDAVWRERRRVNLAAVRNERGVRTEPVARKSEVRLRACAREQQLAREGGGIAEIEAAARKGRVAVERDRAPLIEKVFRDTPVRMVFAERQTGVARVLERAFELVGCRRAAGTELRARSGEYRAGSVRGRVDPHLGGARD